MIQGIKKGFSLVELLVVIAIIGILAAVGITAYSGYTSSAKQKAALANHAQVAGLLNSEFAKCAAGAGNFIWSTGGSSCASQASATEIVAHFSSIGLMNPYSRTNAQVSLAKNVAGEAWLGTDEDATLVLGQTAVHCTGSGCTIATKQGPAAADDTYLAIGAY